MPEIVLATLNARYAHASFGLRYLFANLAELQPRAVLLEFDINQRPVDILESILAQNPKIVGLGVYIWNATQSEQLVADLKRVRPDITVILGGPEVSYETDQQEICRLADFVITGEADLAFAKLCRELLNGKRPLMKVIAADLPEFASASGPLSLRERVRVRGRSDTETSAEEKHQIEPLSVVASPGNATQVIQPSKAAGSLGFGTHPHPSPLPEGEGARVAADAILLPYDFYTPTDIANRVIYVEASRGCPFKCEFCLSSLDVPVRNVPIDDFLAAMQTLLDRGVLNFKFVDRTFNLNLNISKAILAFFLERLRPGLFLHFEMIPDRLPEALREIIRQFPPAVLQFEVGVQTFNDEVSARISRRQDNEKLGDNLNFLRKETGVHVHADLIVGLPGEDIASFGRGFDRLVALAPQEIQVGMLKRLRGTPIVRHDAEWGMVYSPHAPYEVLQTAQIDFATMQRMRRFARYWDLIANSGNFVETTPLVWGQNGREIASDVADAIGDQTDLNVRAARSSFQSFLRLSDWLYLTTKQTHAIALQTLAELIFRFLTEESGIDPAQAAQTIWRDYQRIGRSDRPAFLKPFISDSQIPPRRVVVQSAAKRQARHKREPQQKADEEKHESTRIPTNRHE